MTNTYSQNQAMKKKVSEMANERIFEFQNGVPGFPTFKRFCIRDLDDGTYPPLKVMVSQDNPAISFILYPHANGGSLFDENTILGFARAYDVNKTDVEVYSMVTVRQPDGDITLTTNLNAPIVLNCDAHKGWQHIISNNENNLVFPLDALSKSLQEMHHA